MNLAMVRGQSKVERYGWLVQDRPGRFMLIPKDRLQVDHAYQRDTARRLGKILRLAGAWSWIACGTLLVAHRDGGFFILDGQMRWSAAQRREDISQLPCMVYESSGQKGEAGAFLISNSERQPLRSSERFKGLMVEGNAEAHLVAALLAEAHRSAAGDSSPTSAGCLSMLLRHAAAQPEVLKKVWPTLTEICDGQILHSRLVDALVYIEARMPEGQSLSKAKWRSRLLQIGFDDLVAAVNRAGAYHGKGGSRVWADGVLGAMNKRLHNPLVLDA